MMPAGWSVAPTYKWACSSSTITYSPGFPSRLVRSVTSTVPRRLAAARRRDALKSSRDPALAARLDIQDRITIIREKVAITDYRVVGRKDEVWRSRWRVTLEVGPNNAA